MLAALLILVAAFVLLPSFLPSGGGLPTAEAAGLNDQLKDKSAELQETRDNLAEAKAARDAASADVAALDQNIEGLEGEVSVAAAAYDEAAGRLAQLREELDGVTVALNQQRKVLVRTERDLATQQDVFNTRLVNVYKSGGRSVYLAGLLDLTSISQLIGRLDLLSAIAEQDHDILTQIEALKSEVEEQKAALEVERAHVSVLEQEQRTTTKTLGARAEKKRAALADLEEALKAKRRVLAAAEKDVGVWRSQEDKLLAESQRIAAEIKAAEVRARAASGDSAGGGGSGGSGDLYRPVPGAITSAFGYRIHPIFHVRKMHTGVDMHAGMGTPIRAAAAGTVVSAGWRGGYGKCVVISHGGDLATLYGHQSTIRVSAGQSVKRGDVIGEVGSTGYSTGPHLHFEVRVGGSPVDPARYL